MATLYVVEVAQVIISPSLYRWRVDAHSGSEFKVSTVAAPLEALSV